MVCDSITIDFFNDLTVNATVSERIYTSLNSYMTYSQATNLSDEQLSYLKSGLSVTSCNSSFYHCAYLQSIPWNELNIETSQCTTMLAMFENCSNLVSLNLSNMNTSKVTNMRRMFYGCLKLKEIICPNGFDMSSCTIVNQMFYMCSRYSGEPLHFKNVPRDLDFSNIGGTKGKHYVIDNYID